MKNILNEFLNPPPLSELEQLAVMDLLNNYEETERTGKGRLFRKYDMINDYVTHLGLTEEITPEDLRDLIFRRTLYDRGIGYFKNPCPETAEQNKFALYLPFVKKYLKKVRGTSTTTTRQQTLKAPKKKTAVHATTTKTIPPMGIPLSYPLDRLVDAPEYLADLVVHPPGRLHKVELFCDSVLDPRRCYLLREAADKGRKVDKNNRYGGLTLCTWCVSSKGRLRIFVTEPDHIAEALEEFGRFCGQVGFRFNGTFTGRSNVHIGYDVSGNVKKYKSIKIHAEIRGYKARFYFDRSQGDWELEVQVQGKGPPEALHQLTNMIVVNGVLAEYLNVDFPNKVVEKILAKMKQEGLSFLGV